MFDTECPRQQMVSAPAVGGDGHDLMGLDELRDQAATGESDRHQSRKADWTAGDAGSADVRPPPLSSPTCLPDTQPEYDFALTDSRG